MQKLGPQDFTFQFSGLSRPECIIATRSGGLFVSHNPEGVQHIAPDGTRTLYGRRGQQKSDQYIPNGIALGPDGKLLIANTGLEGGVWAATRDGDCRPLLMEVAGRHIYPANFVLADQHGRLWISVSTTLVPRSKAYNRNVANGYIVQVDAKGARIVAEGLGYSNECRLSNDGNHLYVNETFSRRLSRFPVLADGSLGARETFATLGFGDFPDGGTFDAEGHFWVTSVVSNRIYRFAPSGEAALLFEDSDAAYVAKAEEAFLRNALTIELLYSDAGKTINHISSLTFGGEDLQTAYLGTLKMDRLPTFRSRVAGARPAHWEWRF